MWFCPLDGTLLQLQSPASVNTHKCAPDKMMFVCATCPYSCEITQNVTKTLYPKRKAVDDILGGATAWDNVDKTSATCPACNFGEAYFLQIQIRSADEPMSVFYKCVKCSNQWNDR